MREYLTYLSINLAKKGNWTKNDQKLHILKKCNFHHLQWVLEMDYMKGTKKVENEHKKVF